MIFNLIKLVILIIILYFLNIINIPHVYRFLTHDKNNPNRYRNYYEIETKMLYKYIVNNNIFKRNQNILEIGCGGGIFYEEHKNYLIRRNNNYTCIDIDEPSINISKQKVDYVNFIAMDIHNYSIKELGKYDIILLVQTYMCVPNMIKILENYFKENQNGKVIMIHTIFPEYLTEISNVYREIIMKKYFGVDWGKSMTLNHMIEISKILKRHLTYTIIGKSPLHSMNEYIMIFE